MNRLQALRAEMSKYNADCYYVPATDPYNNEYVPEHWQRRRFISQFSGSAGDAMITQDRAFLWTDPRYYLQAETELDANEFELIKASQHNQPLIDWLQQQPTGFRLALDPKVITIQQAKKIQKVVTAKQASLHLLDENLIDAIWQDQPALPCSKIILHESQYNGQSSEKKIAKLRDVLQKEQANAIVLNNLAEIAWLLNIRGKDILYNPLVIASAILTQEKILLFVDAEKITPEIQRYFSTLKIQCCDPTLFKTELNHLDGTVWLDPNSCNYWIETQLQNSTIFYKSSPLMHWKAVKNSVELAGIQQAHNYDGAAVIKFLYWLETHWQEGISELSAAEKLAAIRRENPLCVDLSFNTISGFGPNGAIIHYAVDEKSNRTIDDSSLYLFDSGGQYPMGTTDITRTIHLGTPTDEQRLHYTLVLKGHLALRLAIFPRDTHGEHLNVLARHALWQHGLDYGHGTGHGVGCYSCVHEFPPRISAGKTDQALQPNMVLSNEPGVYFANQYGIRLENLCRVIEVFSAEQCATQHGPFYGFEDLTLVPYCRRLIDETLLNSVEVATINAYHQRVFATIKNLLTNKALVHWLQLATEPLDDTQLAK